MKKIGIVFLVLSVVLSACKEMRPPQIVAKGSEWKFDKLSTQAELFLDNDSTKKGMEQTLEFNYPSEFKNDSLLKRIQSAFVVAFAGDEYKDQTPKEAFSFFEKKNTDENLELGKLAEGDAPDFSQYYKSVKTTVFDTTSLTITAKTEIDSYTGGAHGSHLVYYSVIDLRNGELIKGSDIFRVKDNSKLISLIKESLVEVRNSMGDPITILDSEYVKPTDNFYFSDKGIVYVYNEYDIAPYSDGLIEVTLPYDKIRELLLSHYEAMIGIKVKTE